MDQDEGYMVDAELTDFDDEDEQNESGGDDDLGIEVIDHHNTGHKKETPLDEMQQEVLTPSEVVDHMSQIINDVTSVMQIPGTTARILLGHYKWDKERLMEA
uniref:E3 ubiquitin-protein ligase ARIH1-like UBA-like domain-containing protein n=1 Tax=Romanomermis culicivorax TaxID=13658 RepID=A0A915KLS5_ROMCU